MADNVKFGFEFDDSNVIDVLDAIEKKMGAVEGKQGEVGDAFSKMFADLKKDSGAANDYFKLIEDALKGNIKDAKDYQKSQAQINAEMKTAEKAATDYRGKLKEVAGEFRILGVNVGGFLRTLKEKKDRLLETGRAAQQMGQTLGAIRFAAAAGAIGLVVVALTALIAAFTRTREGGEKFRVFMSQVTATADVLIDRFGKLGLSIVDVFTGKPVEALRNLKAAFTGISDELSNDIRLAGELERQLIALEKASALINAQRSLAQVKIKELNLIAKDTTKSDQTRIKATREAIALVKEDLKARENLAVAGLKRLVGEKEGQEKLAGVLDLVRTKFSTVTDGAELANKVISELGIKEAGIKDLEEFVKGVESLSAIRIEALDQETQFNNKLNTIQQQRLQKIQQQKEADAKAFAELKARLSELNQLSVELGVGGQVEVLSKQREAAVKEFEKLVEEIDALAKKLGQDIDVSQEIGLIFKAIQSEFDSQFDQLKLPTIDIKQIVSTPDAKAAGVKVTEAFGEGIKQGTDTVGEAIDRFLDKVSEDLGLTREELGEFGSNVLDSFSSIQDSFLQITAAQIDANNQIIDSIRNRISEVESALDEELRLAEQGFSNNVDVRRRELAALKEQETKALQEQAVLRQKALRQQLLADNLQQVSSLITTAAEVTKGFAKFGPAALILIPLAIATIFKIFANAKATAIKSALPVRRKGGKIEGRTHEQGGEVVLVGGQPALEAERDEWIIGTKHSKEHDKFLERLNAGEFTGVNLNRVVNMIYQPAKPINIKELRQAGKDFDDSRLVSAFLSGATNIVDAVNKKKQFVGLSDEKYMEIEQTNSGQKIKIVILPRN